MGNVAKGTSVKIEVLCLTQSIAHNQQRIKLASSKNNRMVRGKREVKFVKVDRKVLVAMVS
jgi:hypothetical protein